MKLTHKQQLCPGEMHWGKIPGRYGPVSGWKCEACGRTLPRWVHSLLHRKEVQSPEKITTEGSRARLSGCARSWSMKGKHMKLAIIDLDGVIADATARFAKAEEVKQAYIERASSELYAADEREATNIYWRAVFNPEYVPTDTLIDGVNEALHEIEQQGYDLFLLTSRPESMREATLNWLFSHFILLPEWSDYRLVMKPSAFQYVKTVVWKAGMVQTLEALYGATDLLIIDDEQVNIDEHLKYFSNVQTRELCKSLAEAVAKLQGTWVEPDPFLPE